MKSLPSSRSSTSSATSAKAGAFATIALEIPVRLSMKDEIGVLRIDQGGPLAHCHSASTSMMPISVMRSAVAVAPVVSRSTKAKGGKDMKARHAAGRGVDHTAPGA
jgi:hypothetical protein